MPVYLTSSCTVVGSNTSCEYTGNIFDGFILFFGILLFLLVVGFIMNYFKRRI